MYHLSGVWLFPHEDIIFFSQVYEQEKERNKGEVERERRKIGEKEKEYIYI